MASFVFNRASEKIAEYASDGRPDYYIRVKRRTWRTLWLVKRTYRVPQWNPINLTIVSGVGFEPDVVMFYPHEGR